jgi:hypothetical protein
MECDHSVKVVPILKSKLELEDELNCLILCYKQLKTKHDQELVELDIINKRY